MKTMAMIGFNSAEALAWINRQRGYHSMDLTSPIDVSPDGRTMTLSDYKYVIIGLQEYLPICRQFDEAHERRDGAPMIT